MNLKLMDKGEKIMFKESKPYFIRTISSLHVGSGNDLGVVDLPIQREKHTSFPKIESSSLKGSLRETLEKNVSNELKIHLTFGYDRDSASKDMEKKFIGNDEFSGCLGFSDVRLLLFPVKSAKGVFALITCPYILKRYKEEMILAKESIQDDFNKIKLNSGECLVSSNSSIKIGQNVILEEYSFNITNSDFNVDNSLHLIKLDKLKEKLVILHDDDFKNFVNLSTEVITRTKIDNLTGTVSKGQLFNEEYLPPESILYFLIFSSPVFQKDENLKKVFSENSGPEEKNVLKFFDEGLPEYFHIGGNATLGKGIVKVLNHNKGGK